MFVFFLCVSLCGCERISKSICQVVNVTVRTQSLHVVRNAGSGFGPTFRPL